jgi:hypothetical protein
MILQAIQSIRLVQEETFLALVKIVYHPDVCNANTNTLNPLVSL